MKIITQTEIVFDEPGEAEQATKFNEENNKTNDWSIHCYAAHTIFMNRTICEVPIKEVNNNGSKGNGNNSKGSEEDS